MSQTEWSKFKASVQEELHGLLSELERLQLESSAAAIRPLATSPEDHYETGNVWVYSVWETASTMASSGDIPTELRARFRQLAEAADPRYKG
jgi:hypothetical protein